MALQYIPLHAEARVLVVQGSVLDEERKAATALPQLASSRLPPPTAAADSSRPNPLLFMPMAELRALTAQLEGDIEQTMQHHKQDMVRRLLFLTPLRSPLCRTLIGRIPARLLTRKASS
jgi:hypothetical protein